MKHPNSEPSQINANPTTSQYTQCNSTKQLAHKSSPVPGTTTNEHPNMTTTQFPSQTQEVPSTIHPNVTHLYTCAQCDKVYESKGTLNRHQKRKHPNTTTTTPSHTQTDLPFRCTQCNKGYKIKTSLYTHLKEKHSITPPAYKCSQCDKVFHIISTFNLHRSEKHLSTPITYVCTQCNKRFQSRSGFRIHWRKAYPSTPILYKFTRCNKQFLTLLKLLKHNKEFHERVHQPDCQQHDSPSPEEVERKFKCTKCPKKYPRADTLSRHVKEKHSNDSVGIHIHPQNSVNEIINESAESILGGMENSSRENPLQVVPKRKRRKKRTKRTWTRAKQHRPTQARVEPVTESPENFASTSTMYDPPQASGQELVLARRVPCDICGKILQKRSLSRHRRLVHRTNDVAEDHAVQDHDDTVGIVVQEGIDVQPEIDDGYVINNQYEIYAQHGIAGRDQHGVDGPNGMEYQDEESNQSSISIIEVKSESSQSSNIAPFEPVMDQQTRQIVFELKQLVQFINHLLSKDSSDGFTLETLLKEFEKLSSLITKLGAPGQDHLAEEWMQRKCSLWDEISYFKKKSLQDELEHKRKLIMKLIERNEKKQLVVDAIEDLKGTLNKVQRSQEWDSILLDIRSLYNRLYVESIKSEFNSKRTKTKELLPESLKTRLGQLSHLSPNDLENRQYTKLDLLVNFLLDVHSHLKSNQALDRLTDEQFQLVQSVVRTKLPLKMSNIFQNDYLSQFNLVSGQAWFPLRALCCFCVNWKASNM